MKIEILRGLICLATLTACGRAHVMGDAAHDESARRMAREFRPVQVSLHLPPLAALSPASNAAYTTASAFERFAPAVKVRTEGDFLYVESDGLPAHNMMVGITAWQQQVPLPQPYRGDNSWRIPLRPVPAPNGGVTIRDHFLRGAIALAANGIPIFNPQNNRGEISLEIGELDEWGGHCGRADDYHYHVAPLHLQAALGKALPVAYALDGYPIHGLTEPDESVPASLDKWNGHEHAPLGYHYHASKKYPYLNGGFRGVVVEREEQVDPQPRAQGVREALTQLRGARITGFKTLSAGRSFALGYEVRGQTGKVDYEQVGDGVWRFRFTGTDGTVREETYRAGERRGGGGRKGKDGKGRKEDE
jgi:hypothetical protein